MPYFNLSSVKALINKYFSGAGFIVVCSIIIIIISCLTFPKHHNNQSIQKIDNTMLSEKYFTGVIAAIDNKTGDVLIDWNQVEIASKMAPPNINPETLGVSKVMLAIRDKTWKDLK